MALWEAASNQLDFLLLSRIEYFEQRRMMSLLIAAFAVLSACLLTTGINRSINVPLKRQADELRMLNAALNAEVNEKLAARAALVEASHRAGMAEIATGVLHNVGNVLNSVNTSATVIREKLDNSRVPILGRAAAMLKDHEQDVGRFLASDPKGKQIPQLLCQLADVMAGDRNQVVDEITQLTRNIEHIRQIVQSQQTFAKGGCQDEEFDLTELLEDSLRMTGLARGVHGIELVRDFHPCPHARICRHKVLQIVVNLISNARKAVIESGYPKKKIIVSLEPVKAAGPGRVRIRVTDNGVGIPAENLERIFQHGLTTRKDGHGFGLHTALLDTQAMGGSMTVCSPGPGLGAIFLLELPLEPIPQSDEQLEPLTF
jgi:signal transduction histidine kinase